MVGGDAVRSLDEGVVARARYEGAPVVCSAWQGTRQHRGTGPETLPRRREHLCDGLASGNLPHGFIVGRHTRADNITCLRGSEHRRELVA